MRTLSLAKRGLLEMVRDPLTLIFGAGFPLALMLLLSAIQSRVPVPLFAPERLTPGILCFGQSFLALFAAQGLSRDRSSALMLRLLCSPMTARDCLLGWALPLLGLALAQGTLCLGCAFALGLDVNPRALAMLAAALPGAACQIALGLLCGSLLNDRQVGGICGALLTNLSAWLSGAWFDLSLMGGAVERIARMLPFANCVDAGRAALAGDWAGVAAPLLIASGWALALSAAAGMAFARKARAA